MTELPKTRVRLTQPEEAHRLAARAFVEAVIDAIHAVWLGVTASDAAEVTR